MHKPLGLYEFGAFSLNPSENRLCCEGRPIHLPPKAFALLVLLAQNGGHLMEKADLITAIWPDTHVEEANLAQTVSVVRKALGDAPGGCLYVETVPKRGYRMAVEVKWIAWDPATLPVVPKTGPALPVKSILSVGALVGGALACFLLYRTLTGH